MSLAHGWPYTRLNWICTTAANHGNLNDPVGTPHVGVSTLINRNSMKSFGSVLLIVSVALALLTIVGLIRPGIVMQKDRKSVLAYYTYPAVFTFLIGNYLIN